MCEKLARMAEEDGDELCLRRVKPFELLGFSPRVEMPATITYLDYFQTIPWGRKRARNVRSSPGREGAHQRGPLRSVHRLRLGLVGSLEVGIPVKTEEGLAESRLQG